MIDLIDRARSDSQDLRSWLVLCAALFVTVPYFSQPNALFWDDYTLFSGMDLGTEASEMGRPWVAPILSGLALLGPWSYKVLSLFSLVAGFFALARILSFHNSLSTVGRFLAAAIFVVAPVAFSRLTPAIFTFQVSVVFFLIWWAWFLQFIYARHRRSVLHGFLLTAGLIVALATNGGLLPFFLVPFLHGLFIHARGAFTSISIHRYLRKVWWMVPLPFLTYIVTRNLFAPYGRFEDYNSIVLPAFGSDGALRLWMFLIVALIGMLIFSIVAWQSERFGRRGLALLEGIGLSVLAATLWEIADFRDRAFRIWQVADLDELANLVLPGIMWALAGNRLFVALRPRFLGGGGDHAWNHHSLWALGLMSSAFSYLPYLLVGKPPHPAAFADRLEILMPVSLVFLWAAIAPCPHQSKNGRLVSLLTSGAIISSMVMTTGFQFSMLLVDWRKQSLVVDALRANQILAESSTLLIIDETQFLNWDNRGNPLYETTGWGRSAYGEPGILVVNRDLYADYVERGILNDESLQRRYGFLGWDPEGVLRTIVVTTDSSRLEVLLGQGIIHLGTVVAD